jgi:hypothetical protein
MFVVVQVLHTNFTMIFNMKGTATVHVVVVAVDYYQLSGSFL